MNLYVYTTEDCNSDVRDHAIQKDFNLFKKRLLDSQRTTFFDNFPPPYLKKRFKRQLRLLASERRIDNDIVIVFYRILVRGGKEYERFLSDPKEFGDNNFAPLVTDKELKVWLKTQKTEAPIPEKLSLTNEEYSFLYGLVGDDNSFTGDYFIYESYEWIKSIQSDDIIHRLILIPNVLMNIIDKLDEKGTASIDNYTIHYKICQEHKVLVLLGIVKKDADSNFLEKYKEIFEKGNIELINRISGKSYPATILVDSDSWINIQKNNDSNIALSPEETDLLKSVQIPSDEKGFPLFINGRAGSGKSTILQYLFADYMRLYYKNAHSTLKPPVYLTYSNSLVEKCRRIVDSILKYSYKGVEEEISLGKKEIDHSIKEFKAFLIERIPNETRSTSFNNDRYIDYSKYKKLWHDHFSNDPSALKEYGPDISWHIIRSFIKGISIDGYLEKDEYLELPKEEKSITTERFNIVYDKVWLAWYQNLCNIENEGYNYWDDQDIVRYLLENDLIEPRYPAIFCDEAQDFTRIELELLLRLNIFTERKIDSSILKRIPFAFAGDPFQTLNPTGFRWDSIKSTYVEKFVHSLAPEMRYGNPELNYQELSFNYRSSENIVKLCNSLQILRLILFDYQTLRPQVTWHIEKDPPIPVFFNLNESLIREKIKEQTDLCIIVPCLEGEERQFVEDDEHLKQLVQKDETGVPLNVFSPMRAKGLEFPRVLLYRFGDNRPPKLSLLDFQIDSISKLDKDEKIPLEYFINQVYVALSRAQKRLFIIDEIKSFDDFWRFSNDSVFQEEILAACRDKHLWHEQLGNLVQGTSTSWSEDREDPAEVARQREEEGILKRDPYFLRQAAMYYRICQNDTKEAECRSKFYEFEGKFQKAGEIYIKIQDFESAINVFWKGKYYTDLSKIAKTEAASRFSNKLEVRIAVIINDYSVFATQESFLRDLFEYLSACSKSNSLSVKESTLWSESLSAMLKNNIAKKTALKSEDWKLLQEYSIKIADYINIPSDLLANISFEAADFEKAIKYFEDIGDINNSKYREAKVSFLIDIERKGVVKISNEEYKIIADFYNLQGNIDKAIQYYLSARSIEKVFEMLNSGKIIKTEFIQNTLRNLCTTLGEMERWVDLIRFMDGEVFSKKTVKDLLAEMEKELLVIAVKEIATSALLPESDNRIKEKTSEFLKQKFIIRPITTWEKLFYPELVGCALEKAGRDIDCLKFYERIQGSPKFDEPTKRRARLRWIWVKLKQAEREESNGISEAAAKHREEANAKMQEYKIDKCIEPRFPSITGFQGKPSPSSQVEPKKTSIESTATIDSPVTVEIPKTIIEALSPVIDKEVPQNLIIGDYSISINRPNRRINIEDKKMSHQIAILLDDKSCQSIDMEFIESDLIFTNEANHLQIEFESETNLVRISFLKYAISVEFDSE